MSIGTYPSSVEVGLPLSVSQGGTGATTAATARTNLGLGTLATQDASAVAITGGSVQATSLGVNVAAPVGAGQLHVGAFASIQQPPTSVAALHIGVYKSGQFGILLHALENDASGNGVLAFSNVAGGNVGSITTTATATAYNTSSDARLKHAIAALTGALDAIRALRPVTFRWNADDSQGHGFLAHELQQTIPDAVSGEPDAVNDDGTIQPQQIDHSKLVPWLVSAVQELLARIEVLEARLV